MISKRNTKSSSHIAKKISKLASHNDPVPIKITNLKEYPLEKNTAMMAFRSSGVI